ncbi:MAG: thioredoxin family protein [Acidobacteriia bacterium]|nr:thioredoxin family protein [Terriglobia bacterium]
MKTPHLIWIVAFFLCAPAVPVMQAAPQQSRATKASEGAASFAFEPLDQWKAAVLAGDKAALTNFYATSPAASAKTPQGETQDPAEEPAFWSALKPQGLDRLDVKVLEVKTPQPGMMSLYLRFEAGVKTSDGEKTGIISAGQIWLQKLGEWKIVRTQRGDIAPKPVRRLPEPAKPNTALYADPAEGPIEISAALAAATKDHKRVLLIFGGNWCYDCHVLDTTFHTKEFAPLVNANFHVVHVNIGNYDVNLDLAKKYEIPLEKGVPSLAVLDPDGTLLVSMKNGEFESTVRIGPQDVLDFLNKWKPNRGG